MEPFHHLYFHKYRINLRPKELIHLPEYKASAIRGVFGNALRRIVCAIKKPQCDDCMLRFKCVYSEVMETPIPQEHPYHGKYPHAPHPYIIIPQLTGKRYFQSQDSLYFDMALIGKASEYLPYFIYAFTEMGKIGLGKGRGKFDVTTVDALYFNGTKAEIFNHTDNFLRPSNNRLDFTLFLNNEFEGDEARTSSLKCEDEITISFETPARIKEKNRLAPDIPFKLLISRLYERAVLLSHFHCGAELNDFDGFVEESGDVETVNNKLRWKDWERYSARQDTRMILGGWLGEITYKGDFQKYLPLLRLGEHIHVGKATVFGLGKYRIIY